MPDLLLLALLVVINLCSSAPVQWNDHAIVVKNQRHGDHASIVTVFTKEHGIRNGYVRGITSKHKRATYQIGNIVDVNWRGRLAEHLGNFQGEVLSHSYAQIIDDIEKIQAMNAYCSLLVSFLPEHDPHEYLFEKTRHFLQLLGTSTHWHAEYVLCEIALLSDLGFGLDLASCVASGSTENLIYISPKSGCAVSQEAGKPYHHKLLTLPQFVRNLDSHETNWLEIKNGLAICTHFLNKYSVELVGRGLPQARELMLSTFVQRDRELEPA